MDFPETTFSIIEASDCPIYQSGDMLKLSGRTLHLPDDKPTCIVLVEDIRNALSDHPPNDSSGSEETQKEIKFGCSGPSSNCSGSIQLIIQGTQSCEPSTDSENDPRKGKFGKVATLLKQFSIFKSLGKKDIINLVTYLRVKEYRPEEAIIRKGDPGINLFIILDGKVEVLGDDGITITFLETGEVFGEMSLLSGDPTTATIKAVEGTKVLYISGKHFRKLLNQFPVLQNYFSNLLARRLANTNLMMTRIFSSGMIGKLSEVTLTELLQTLNLNQKTGILTIHLTSGPAEVFFNEGGIVNAVYNEEEGKNAFFNLFISAESPKESESRFKFVPGLTEDALKKFEIGDFMWLLMEGLNRIDEDDISDF